MTDYELMLLCAVRYALGRRTYIVGLVCDFITSQIDTLSKECLNTLIRDIKDQERFGYGDECDEARWMQLLELAVVVAENATTQSHDGIEMENDGDDRRESN